MILQGPQDDKFEKRQNRLNFLNQVALFSELVILYDKLQYFLNDSFHGFFFFCRQLLWCISFNFVFDS